METAAGQTAQPVNLSNRGGTPTIIPPVIGTIKKKEPPQSNKTMNAQIQEPCQRFMNTPYLQDGIHLEVDCRLLL
jgi:hypothetical protein